MNFLQSKSGMLPVAQVVCLSIAIAVAVAGCKKADVAVAPATPQPKVEGETVSFQTNSPQLSSLSVQSAEKRKWSITHLTGRLYWDDEVTVRVYTPVAGRVIHVLRDLGDPISVGTPLAEVDSPDFNQTRANARTAVANLAMADKAFSRAKDLLAHGAAAQKDVEAAEAIYIGAQAEKERSEAVLANYGSSLTDTNALFLLRSPIAGTLVDKNINPGQEVRADLMLANAPNLFAPLYVVSDPTKLWMQLDATEGDLSALSPGDALEIHSPAFPDKSFHGTVEKIGNTLDPSTRTIKVRAMVDNPNQLLRAEMYVLVDVTDRLDKTEKAGVEIPAKAIFTKNNDSYLFIESAPGQFVRQKVSLGTERDGKVPVYEGLQAGQRVVTEGALLLEAVLEPTS